MIRLQLIVWLTSVLPEKNWVGRRVEAKRLRFFEKNICILLVSYLTFSVKQMLFQPPIYQQNKGEGVCFYLIISMYIYLYYPHLLFICIYL